MFETRLGILVQTLIWETSKHGQRGAILLGGRELVRGLRGTRTFHLFHLVCKFPWIFAWFGFCGCCFVWLVCLFLLAFAFGEICFLSSLIPVVDRQCLALVRQCRKKTELGPLLSHQDKPWRDHFGSVRGGPVRRQSKDKEMTKEDRRTGRQTGRGGRVGEAGTTGRGRP